MTTIVTRTNKTTELLYAEGDANLNLDVIAASSDPSIGLAANRSTYECTSTFNFILPLASSMISPTPGSTAKCNDYRVTIKNAGAGTITVKTTSPDTLDGVTATGDQAILPNEAFEYQVNVGKDGWISTSKVSASALSAAAVITTNALVKGSDGTRSVKESGIIVDVSNNTSGVGTLGCGNITSTGTIGGTTITASASFSGPGTNLTGTAASLTAGTVTTNANLTGHVTSTGNAAVLGSFTSLQLKTALTNETGSGAAVFATSPTLVTPALGTPSSGTLSGCSGLPIVGGTTGTLSVARGGTDATTAGAALTSLGAAASSDWATLDHDFGSITASTETVFDWTHGLGTNDVEFGGMIIFDSNVNSGSFHMLDSNKYIIGVYDTGATTPTYTPPASGDISLIVKSNFTQTLKVRVWARKR